ncbi:vacuolar fusion protein MON1 homolog A-like [Uloborus diversus]|uniref:vacuolar fusion protein MON1 homolog A-like n=1 Tax=Uloborus diversus TaxID=327109 RepID=UPI002409124D|nr:vacuolar fusion protein MON1 homolog A-like [Uloborus diversus]
MASSEEKQDEVSCSEEKEYQKSIEEEIELPKDFEPGASRVGILLSTASYEEESVSNGEFDDFSRKSSCISEIEQGVSAIEQNVSEPQETKTDEEEKNSSDNSAAEILSIEAEQIAEELAKEECDELNSAEWKKQKKQIFVLSEAGKPIYTRHGNEDNLVTLMGVMQALVSFVQQNGDTIRSIHAEDKKFVFLHRVPLILVAVSSTKASVPQLLSQLTYVYNQITSVLTYSNLNRIFEQRRNYDLRRLLGGAEKFLDRLVDVMDKDPSFLLNAVRCLPLDNSIREVIAQTLTQYCGKIKNIVFAILLAENQLVTLVRMKKYFLHPVDLHLVMNLVSSSESFKSVETWIPICLPKFDASGFLHGHISYLDEENKCCLLLLTVDKDMFFPLKECRSKIVERLKKYHCLEAINKSVNNRGYSVSQVGIPDVRHFLYKSRSAAQFTAPRIEAPYVTTEDWNHLFGLYQYLHHRMYKSTRPLKMLYYSGERETMVGWHMQGFELYAAFEPLATKADATNAMKKIVHWIKKEEDDLFIMISPTI